MKSGAIVAAMLVLSSTGVLSLETMFQASRFSRDTHEINLCGAVINLINLTTNGFDLRRVR